MGGSTLNLPRCLSTKVTGMGPFSAASECSEFPLKMSIKFGAPLHMLFCGTLFTRYGTPSNSSIQWNGVKSIDLLLMLVRLNT